MKCLKVIGICEVRKRTIFSIEKPISFLIIVTLMEVSGVRQSLISSCNKQ